MNLDCYIRLDLSTLIQMKVRIFARLLIDDGKRVTHIRLGQSSSFFQMVVESLHENPYRHQIDPDSAVRSAFDRLVRSAHHYVEIWNRLLLEELRTHTMKQQLGSITKENVGQMLAMPPKRQAPQAPQQPGMIQGG